MCHTVFLCVLIHWCAGYMVAWTHWIQAKIGLGFAQATHESKTHRRPSILGAPPSSVQSVQSVQPEQLNPMPKDGGIWLAGISALRWTHANAECQGTKSCQGLFGFHRPALWTFILPRTPGNWKLHLGPEAQQHPMPNSKWSLVCRSLKFPLVFLGLWRWLISSPWRPEDHLDSHFLLFLWWISQNLPFRTLAATRASGAARVRSWVNRPCSDPVTSGWERLNESKEGSRVRSCNVPFFLDSEWPAVCGPIPMYTDSADPYLPYLESRQYGEAESGLVTTVWWFSFTCCVFIHLQNIIVAAGTTRRRDGHGVTHCQTTKLCDQYAGKICWVSLVPSPDILLITAGALEPSRGASGLPSLAFAWARALCQYKPWFSEFVR